MIVDLCTIQSNVTVFFSYLKFSFKMDILLQVTDDQRYMFKAPFKLRDKKSLLKLLKRRDLNGEGGVFYDDVNESLPKAEKIVQSLTGDGKIIQVRIWLGVVLESMMIYRFWSVFMTPLM